AKADSYQALLPKAQQEGSVRVIVTLNIPFKPEGLLLAPASVQGQRNGIAKAQEALAKRLESFNSTVIHNFKYVPIIALQVDAAGLSDLNANPQVKYIQEDVPEPPTLSESIPLIGADQAWLSGYTGSGQAVAILDTGVDGAHEFLSGKVVAEACFSTTYAPHGATTLCPDGNDPDGFDWQIGTGAGVNCSGVDGCDHGTHVAGIAAGSGASFSGVAKDADIIAIQVFSRFDDSGICGGIAYTPCVLTYNTDQMRALEWVYDQRASFNIASANMSLGGGEYFSNCDGDSRKNIIDTLRSVGIATVIASGNSYYRDAMGAPACISSAISVGSTND
ncbi:MAG: S8 family serine peptidase, partial [Anaerolineales bacterium]|nr:S8 family serine peptidase [Anaerolineales bacterium]